MAVNPRIGYKEGWLKLILCVVVGTVAQWREEVGEQEPGAGSPQEVPLWPLYLHRGQQGRAPSLRLHRPPRHM